MVAGLFANKPRVQQLFYQGKIAVLTEGGGPGLDQAALYRQKLYDEVSPEWNKAISKLNARQLHFHLGPGSLSFLRVHKPGKFGDRMDNLRHIIIDSNRHQDIRRGFETGRVYSGLRGVVPVFAFDAETRSQVHVGAVEAGTSLDNALMTIDKTFGVGSAVLLTEKHITSTVWPEYLAERMDDRSSQCGCVLEASSRPSSMKLIDTIVSQTGAFKAQQDVRFFNFEDTPHVLYMAPLRDYLGSVDLNRDNVGSAVFWRDISSETAIYEKEQTFNIIFGLIAFLIVEILLFLGFKTATQHLQNRVKTATTQLRESNRLVTALLENTSDAYFSIDQQDHLTYFNHAAEKLWSTPREEVLGEELWDALPEMASFFYKSFFSARQTREFVHVDGDYPPLEKHLELNIYPWDEGIWAFFQDVTDQKLHEDELLRLANTDALTGIYNRNRFNEILASEVQRASRYDSDFALVVFDIDYFKIVNDAFGHAMGDKVLKRVTRTINRMLRGPDSFCRWGGEEFAVLMPETSFRQACKKAEQFREAIEETSFDHGQPLTISLGVTVYRQGDSFDAIFVHADNCLYDAKSKGRNRVECSCPG